MEVLVVLLIKKPFETLLSVANYNCGLRYSFKSLRAESEVELADMSFSGPFIIALLIILSYKFMNCVEDIPVPGGNTTTTTNSPLTTTTSTTPSPSPVPPTPPSGFSHYITIRFNSIKQDKQAIVDDHISIEHDGSVEAYMCYPTFHWRLVYFIDQYIYHNTSHIACATEPRVIQNTVSCTCFDSVTNSFYTY